MKNKLFVFCSWDGIFFREQAKLVDNQYDVNMVVFSSKSIREWSKYLSLIKIKKTITDNDLPIVYVEYLNFWFLPRFIERIIQNFYVQRVHSKIGMTKDSFIHINTIYEAGFWALQFNKKYKIPYVLDEHQKFILHKKTKRSINQIQEILDTSKKNLVVSHDEARQILSAGFKMNFEVIGNYVDENKFFPIENKKANVFKLISIGAFTYFKDQQTIFKALEVLDDLTLNKKIEFHYLGYNSWGVDCTDEINRIIKEANYKHIKVILYPGFYNRLEIASLLQHSDVFILSSIMEGMCVSLMEALACGLPVCTTQCGGVDELIDDQNGKIVQIRDYKSMANFIKKVVTEEITFDKNSISNRLVSQYGNVAFRNKLLQYYSEAFIKS